MMTFSNSVEKNLETQLDLYPESCLRDIYKSFFQDEFGPGHILNNTEEAWSYFQNELSSMKSSGRRKAEPCGNGTQFCRIPMDLVVDGLITADEYFTGFLSGAQEFRIPEIYEWKKKWLIILGIINERNLLIKNFDEDSAEILDALNNGIYAIHHSRCYVENYDPHYRIFSIHCKILKKIPDRRRHPETP